jgi:transposase
MAPTKDVIERLYYTEKRSTRSIGEMFGVSKTQVVRWLNGYNISLRPFGRGLRNRGISPPTARQLRNMLSDGRDAIAKRFGVDPSAVYQWLRRYHIKTPAEWNRRATGIKWPTRDNLERLYIGEGHTLAEIAEKLNCSKRAVSYQLNRLEIPIRPVGWARSRLIGHDGHVVKSTYELRVCDWLTEHGIPHDYEPRLCFTKQCRGDFRVGSTYIEIWGIEHSPKYTRRKAEKRELYRLNNVPLIELSSHHFNARSAWLRILKSELLTSSSK